MSILKEAIAEAKKIKKVAESNARLTLQESFQPRMQRMISSKIREEEGEDEDLESSDDSMGLGSFDEPIDVATDVTTPEPDMTEPAPTDTEDEDIDLDEILRELEGEDDEVMPEEDVVEEEFDIFDDEWYDEDDNSEQMSIEEEDCEDDVYESILRELEGDEEMVEEGEEMEDEPTTMAERRNRRLNRKQRTISEASVMKRLKKERDEALRANVLLKKSLNEVNLLNSKLMYFNKINNAVTLSEDKKYKVMSALDRANTVREVEIAYKAISESLTVKRSATKRSINEGSSSKTVKALKPASQSLKEDFVGKDRWQRLAGIKPLND